MVCLLALVCTIASLAKAEDRSESKLSTILIQIQSDPKLREAFAQTQKGELATLGYLRFNDDREDVVKRMTVYLDLADLLRDSPEIGEKLPTVRREKLIQAVINSMHGEMFHPFNPTYRAVKPLLPRLEVMMLKDPSLRVRDSLADAMKQLHSADSVIPLLVSALTDPNLQISSGYSLLTLLDSNDNVHLKYYIRDGLNQELDFHIETAIDQLQTLYVIRHKIFADRLTPLQKKVVNHHSVLYGVDFSRNLSRLVPEATRGLLMRQDVNSRRVALVDFLKLTEDKKRSAMEDLVPLVTVLLTDSDLQIRRDALKALVDRHPRRLAAYRPDPRQATNQSHINPEAILLVLDAIASNPKEPPALRQAAKDALKTLLPKSGYAGLISQSE